MAWNPHHHEIEAVLKLEGMERYNYCLKRLADTEVVWSLAQDDGWALMTDSDGHQCIPIWPHSLFAQLCATGTWQEYTPRSIPLDAWIERWLTGIAKDGRRIAVFPTTEDRGVVVDSFSLGTDLNTLLAAY